jgi:UPF0755 protein
MLRWLLGTVLIGGLALWLVLSIGFARLEAPLPLGADRSFEVAPGSSIARVATELEQAGVLARASDLTWAARLYGRDTIKTGEYLLTPGLTPRSLLALLESGAVVLHQLTIIEGTRYADLRRVLAEHPAIRVTLQGVSDAEVMARLGAPGLHPEGQFLPDTYRFARGTTDLEFLRRAHLALQRELAAAWTERDAGSPLRDAREALVLASIVEKETGVAHERPAIAGVFVRRLQKGMRLQTDPTVIYGMGERYRGNITKRDLQTDTPYNTYTRSGLPPTPICLPSAAALHAATRPAPGAALYFVATGDGGHAFSATLEQHNAAVRRYLAVLRARRQGT